MLRDPQTAVRQECAPRRERVAWGERGAPVRGVYIRFPQGRRRAARFKEGAARRNHAIDPANDKMFPQAASLSQCRRECRRRRA
eukprot:8428198-Pyramimonas_sp.AAC.1